MMKSQVLKHIKSAQLNDDELKEELNKLREDPSVFIEKPVLENIEWDAGETVNEFIGPQVDETDLALETIVLRVGRPVLAISHDEAVLQFDDAESEVWRNRLLGVKEQIVQASRAVGRIELKNNAYLPWAGTGWLLEENIMVTNSHVASLFARAEGRGFSFRQGINGQQQSASIDFLKEFNNEDENVFEILEIMHIEESPGPDIAFFKLGKAANREMPAWIPLSLTNVAENQFVAIIGYPAKDIRIPEQELMNKIFGDVYEKKRLAPGQITGESETQILHDCTTLGGNSGSVLIDLQTGKAVGLHFSGRFLDANFAVPARIVQQCLDKVKTKLMTSHVKKEEQQIIPVSPNQMLSNMKTESPLNFTIPLKLNVTISLSGDTVLQAMNPVSTFSSAQSSQETDEYITEALPSDYDGRDGYASKFLGADHEVPLPGFTDVNKQKDVLKYTLNGKETQELKYQHFSVVMSISRRQCFFSAVNIDGKTSVPMKRGPWRLDPRIGAQQQIIKECYGLAPKFSRGHMTRREDPIWGSPEEAQRGNSDSMHVTNTVPQMQTMNAGVWLSLENYALQNARKDDMRISVLTGPVFGPADPIKYGVIIPLEFWKIIVFIHDETKKLTATGYMISQKDFLQEQEMIFGAHKTNQVSILSIEKATGLNFGDLSRIDPLNKTEESSSPDAPQIAINNLTDISFY